MRNVNKVILIGNLTRDPEMKTTQSGQTITTFSIATNRQWVTQEGTQHTSTEFHDLVAWAKLAEICAQYLKKGKLIYVEGYLKTRSWETEAGEKRFRKEIVVQDMIMLEKRAKSEEEESEIIKATQAEMEEPAEEETGATEPAAEEKKEEEEGGGVF